MPKLVRRRCNPSPYTALRSRTRYRGAVSRGKASTSCYAVHRAVGCAVPLTWTTRRLACASTTSTKRTVQRTVGTGKKSMETRCARWFFKKAHQVGAGGGRRRTRYFSTVDFATALPSFRHSPERRGESHRGFTVEISRISSRRSLLTAGLPARLVRRKRAPCARDCMRCQARTVAGCPKTTPSRHRAQRREREQPTDDRRHGSTPFEESE